MPERALQLLTPMLDEESTVHAFHARLAGALDGLPWELVVVDDGSTDATPRMLDELAGRDARVRAIHLSRRFGHQMALTACWGRSCEAPPPRSSPCCCWGPSG